MNLKIKSAFLVLIQMMILLMCAALISHSSREYELFGSMAGFYYTGFMFLLLESIYCFIVLVALGKIKL